MLFLTQPLEQFIPTYYYFSEIGFLSFDIFCINKYLFLVICILSTVFFFLFIIQRNKLLGMLRLFYISLNRIMLEMINVVSFNFLFFAILYFSLFLYIYILNLVGLLPNTPCFTTQIFGNLVLSFSLICGITIMNLDKNGMLFFQLFIPKGVPNFLIPFLFCLEFFSYFIRILSLSIRLFSNMVAGHSLLHILFDMIVNVKSFLETKLDFLLFIFGGLILILFIIIIFEFIVAFLQAYVFAIMFSIYLNDLLLLH